MNDEVESRIASMYDVLAQKVEKMENFTIEQAPDVCREIVEVEVVRLQNEAIKGIVSFVFSLIALVSIAFLVHGVDNPGVQAIAAAIFVASLIFLVSGSFLALDSILKMREVLAGKKLAVLKGLRKLMN